MLTFLLLAPIITPLVSVTTSSTQLNLPKTSLNGTTINLNYDDLLAMAKTIVSADLSCYDNPISKGTLERVLLLELLNLSEIDPSIAAIDFTARRFCGL